MLIAILTLSVIAVIGVILWDVRKRKQKLRHPNATQNPSEKTKWAVGITLSVFFTLLAIWDCINPPEPPFGAKGLPWHAAYLLVGKYGPSSLNFFIGLAFFIYSEKRRRGS